jgi:diguanylate cyclase (GGDEF)-like protein
MLPLRNIIPDIFSIVLSNVLTVLSSLFFLEGTRLFRGKKVRKTAIVAVTIAYTIAQLYLTFIDSNMNLRIIIVSFLVAAIFGLIVLELLVKVPSDLRFSYWITGSFFAVYSMFLVYRGVSTCLFPLSGDMLAPSMLHSLTFVMAMFLGIGWVIRFIILNSELLENELKDAQLQLQKMATTDFLTGIANRRLFQESGESEIQRARRYKSPLAVLMIDLDYFKKVNDNYGHATGDKALVTFVNNCKKYLRDVDIFGRLGGEEFAILLPETDINGGKILAERLCTVIAESDIEAEDKIFHITVSIGISELLSGEDKLDALLKRADDAMYEAKRNGRNRVAVSL